MHQQTKSLDFKCSKCNKTFLTKDNMKRHEPIHDGKTWECQICDYVTPLKRYLLRHQKTHQKARTRDFKCSKCNKTFLTKGDMQKHEPVHDGKTWECQICDYVTTLKRYLLRHQKMHLQRSENSSFKCIYCEKTYQSKRALKSHELKHDVTNKKWECDQCDYKFFHKSDLKFHVQTHFKRKKDFRCGVCEKAFVSSKYLSRHNRIHDPLTKNWKCEICDYTTAYKAYLVLHQRTHQKERTRDFQCSKCTKSFLSEQNLKFHEISHIPKGKDWVCEICDFSTKRKKHLVAHKQSHNEVRTNVFHCSKCDQSFYSKGGIEKP